MKASAPYAAHRVALWFAMFVLASALLFFAYSRIAMKAVEIPPEELARLDEALPVGPPPSRPSGGPPPSPKPPDAEPAPQPLQFVEDYWAWLETRDPATCNDPRLAAWRALISDPDLSNQSSIASNRVEALINYMRRGPVMDRMLESADRLYGMSRFHAGFGDRIVQLDAVLEGGAIPWPPASKGIPVTQWGEPVKPDPLRRLESVGEWIVATDAVANAGDGAAFARDAQRLFQLDRRVSIDFPFSRPPVTYLMGMVLLTDMIVEEGIGRLQLAKVSPADASGFLARIPAPELETFRLAREQLRAHFHRDRLVAADSELDRARFGNPDYLRSTSGQESGATFAIKRALNAILVPLLYPAQRRKRFEALTFVQLEVDKGLEDLSKIELETGGDDRQTAQGLASLVERLERSDAVRTAGPAAEKYIAFLHSLESMPKHNEIRLLLYAAMLARASEPSGNGRLNRVLEFSQDHIHGRLTAVSKALGLQLTLGERTVFVPRYIRPRAAPAGNSNQPPR